MAGTPNECRARKILFAKLGFRTDQSVKAAKHCVDASHGALVFLNRRSVERGLGCALQGAKLTLRGKRTISVLTQRVSAYRQGSNSSIRLIL